MTVLLIDARYMAGQQDVNELTTKARTLIFTKAGDLLKYSTDPYLTVVLDLPCSFFMIKSVRCVMSHACTCVAMCLHSKIRLIEEVARSLEFAPDLKHLANLVIDSLSSNGKSQFNSLHLRVEKDAEVWADIMGGKDVREHCCSIVHMHTHTHTHTTVTGGVECLCGGNESSQV